MYLYIFFNTADIMFMRPFFSCSYRRTSRRSSNRICRVSSRGSSLRRKPSEAWASWGGTTDHPSSDPPNPQSTLHHPPLPQSTQARSSSPGLQQQQLLPLRHPPHHPPAVASAPGGTGWGGARPAARGRSQQGRAQSRTWRGSTTYHSTETVITFALNCTE